MTSITKTKTYNKKPLPSQRCCRECELTKSIDNFISNRNKNSNTRRHTCIDCYKNIEKERNKKQYLKRKAKPETLVFEIETEKK